METSSDILDIALDARRKGFVAVPCHPGTKVPRVKWKEWQDREPPVELLREWFRDRCSIAILTTGMVVFDCDDPALAKLVVTHCGDTPHRLKTPRGGVHLGYRRRQGVAVANRVKVKGLAIDIRTDGGLEVIPPSGTANGAYQWLGEGLRPVAELPVACVGWTRKRTRRRVAGAFHGEHERAAKGRVVFPEQYCLKIRSVQGENGSRALVRVVCVLRDAGRTREQIFDFVKRVWGPSCCRPEWSDREIRHCIGRHCQG